MITSALGIDISNLKFDVALIRDNGKLRHKVFPNTPAGFSQLSLWFTKHKVERVHACMEATGTYADALALSLRDRPSGQSRQPGADYSRRAKSSLTR